MPQLQGVGHGEAAVELRRRLSMLVWCGVLFAISVLGVVIFVGLTAFDTQRIKNDYLQFA